MVTPYHQDASVTVYAGDCLDVLSELPDNSVDCVVTDPPYGLEFMGKDWDAPWKPSSVGRGARVATERAEEFTEKGKGHSTSAGPYLAARIDSTRIAGKPFQAWCELWAAGCLRILKPGGHLLAFGGTRTWHRLTCAIEDAGFEIRDSIAWLYGSGFPKSRDVSKAIDAEAGAVREVIGKSASHGLALKPGQSTYVGEFLGERPPAPDITAPATPEAAQWQGWGTALKPAFEPIVVARKPLVGTVAANVLRFGTGALNVLRFGTGALNIDACRIEAGPGDYDHPGNDNRKQTATAYGKFEREGRQAPPNPGGRWPANVCLDESQAAALDQMSGELKSQGGRVSDSGMFGMKAQPDIDTGYGDTGGASRFFYTAKAGSDERITHNGVAHPTVKPLALMRWLVRLVCPPGGVILEPFAGSGTTVEAAILEGFRCIAIEREADYLPMITQRIHRRRDPIAYITAAGEDLGLFAEET